MSRSLLKNQLAIQGRWKSQHNSLFTGTISFNLNLRQRGRSFATITMDDPQLAQSYHFPKYYPLETISWSEQHESGIIRRHILARSKVLSQQSHHVFQLCYSVTEDEATCTNLADDSWSGFYQSVYPYDNGTMYDLALTHRGKRNRPK